jgi:hypothetical protein
MTYQPNPATVLAQAIEERIHKKPVSAAEYSAAAKHDRIALDRLAFDVSEVIEYLDDYADVEDRPDNAGVRPNLAMRVSMMLQTALGRRP